MTPNCITDEQVRWDEILLSLRHFLSLNCFHRSQEETVGCILLKGSLQGKKTPIIPIEKVAGKKEGTLSSEGGSCFEKSCRQRSICMALCSQVPAIPGGCSKGARTHTSLQWQPATGLTLDLSYKSFTCQYVCNLLHTSNVTSRVSKNHWGCGGEKSPEHNVRGWVSSVCEARQRWIYI